MQENEPLSQPRTGAFSPEASLREHREDLHSQAEDGSLGSEIWGK